MKIYCVCRKRYSKEDKSKLGLDSYLTIDEGWSDIPGYSAIFRKCHAKYLVEKLKLSQKVLDDHPHFEWYANFSVEEVYNAETP